MAVFTYGGMSGTTASTWMLDCSSGLQTVSVKYNMVPAASGGMAVDCDSVPWVVRPPRIEARKQSIELPDGARLEVDELGNYRIEDKDAKVTYRANRIREFSPHLNASDLLAQFVRYVQGLGVRQDEVLALPIELFINWLVIEAAERDRDPAPEGVTPVARHVAIAAIRKPRCLHCGRFIPAEHRRHRFAFCDPAHGLAYVERRKARPLLGVN